MNADAARLVDSIIVRAVGRAIEASVVYRPSVLGSGRVRIGRDTRSAPDTSLLHQPLKLAATVSGEVFCILEQAREICGAAGA